MANWTVNQVRQWLKENGFRKHIKIFKEKNIDGNALMQLTDEDISELLIEINRDGTIQEPTIGEKSRFRVKLIEWKLDHENDVMITDSSKVTSANTTDVLKNQHEENGVSKRRKKKEIDNIKHEVKYLIDDDIQIRFLKNPKFVSYLINYIKQEILPIDIEITKIDSNNDEGLFGYSLKLIATKQENRIVKNFIKKLFDSINKKIYDQKILTNWLLKSKSIDIIQNILDNQCQLFTISQLINQTLEIYYFENEKFNLLKNSNDIDQIILKEIIQENIIWLSVNNKSTIQFINFQTKEISLEFQICETELFSEEFENIQKDYEQENSVVDITIQTNRTQTKRSIEIFGYQQLVHEILQKFKELFDRHRLRKFLFNNISSVELDCLANLCHKDLISIKQEFKDGCVKIHIEKNEFSAPQHLKDKVRNGIKALSSHIKSKTLKNIDIYYNMADKLCLNLKTIALANRNYCEIKIKTKSKSYSIPRGTENLSKIPKRIIEQSNLFCASSMVNCQTKWNNGSIEVLVGDIALQKVDVIIIPSTSFGLKESLIERAGEIIENQPLNDQNLVPFITETTGGKLNCQKILFVNWSLPSLIINEDDLIESIQFFISKSIEYVKKANKQSNLNLQSIAFAVPHICQTQEDIFAEEIIEETINQINLTESSSLKILFICSPDQQTLHKQFVDVIQNLQKDEESFGTFSCPTSTITISLMSLSDGDLAKCEKIISRYLTRSIFKKQLNKFENWNQSMINAFYKYAIDRCVLPKLDQQNQIILYGPINSVYEVTQKYHLTNSIIQFSSNISAIDYNIMLSYSQQDSVIVHQLADRLIDEGFSVWRNSNQSTDFDYITTKINRSDCIIICISQNYFDDEFCKNEAMYAQQIGKYIIPVKLEYYRPIGWLYRLIEKDSYFQLFGSENNFNLEYEKLLLKILQYTKPGYGSSSEQTSNILQQNTVELYFLLTPEQKKLKHDKTVRKLMKREKGRITENDKNELENFENIIDAKETECRKRLSDDDQSMVRFRYLSLPTYADTQQNQGEMLLMLRFHNGLLSYTQWLNKLKNLKTILNIAPFTYTGDINDAKFPLPEEIVQSIIIKSSLRHQFLVSIESKPAFEEDETLPTTISFGKKQINISTKKSETDKRSSKTVTLSKNSVKEYETEKQLRKIIPEKPLAKCSFTTSQKLEFQYKFAEQMQKNEDEFKQFCAEYNNRSQSAKKRKTQNYPQAIFGPNPFSKVKLEPRKIVSRNNKIDLPLKFPWNGVFENSIPKIKWTNSSILFFFQTNIK